MMDIDVEEAKLPYLENCKSYYDFDFHMDLLFYVWFIQMAINRYLKEKHYCSLEDFIETHYPVKKKKEQ